MTGIRYKLSIFGFLAAVLFISTSCRAQWVQTKGPYGGNVQCFAARGDLLVAGTTGAGVVRLQPGDTAWQDASSGISNYNIGVLAWCGSNLLAAPTYPIQSIFRSKDSGRSWTLLAGYPEIDPPIVSFAVEGALIYAASAGHGIFRSNDSGNSWQQVITGLQDTTMAEVATNGEMVFAVTTRGDFYASSDSGSEWNLVNTGQFRAAGALLVNNADLFLATGDEIFRSTDSGKTWDHILTSTSAHTIVSFGTNILAGSDQGVFISTNDGDSWTATNNGLRYLNVNALQVVGTVLYVSVGSDGVYVSKDTGATWSPINTGLQNDDVRSLAVTANSVLAGTWDRGAFLSSDDGDHWVHRDSVFSRDFPVVALGSIGSTLLGSSGWILYRSNDAGQSWDTLLKSPSAQFQCLNVNENTIMVGTQSGVIYLSTDSGKNWTSSSLPVTTYVSAVTSVGKVLFATDGSEIYRSDGFEWVDITPFSGGHVFALASFGTKIIAGVGGGPIISSDSGKTWVFPGLDKAFGSLVTIGDTILAGCGGVYLSTDGGMNWTAEDEGLGSISVYALAINNTTVFAGTQARGIYHRSLSEMLNSNAIVLNRTAISPSQAYPNPFSTTSTIRLTNTEPGPAQVTIVNLLGQSVAQLFDGELDAGEHSFEWNASGAAAGTYFCIIRANGHVEQTAIVLSR